MARNQDLVTRPKAAGKLGVSIQTFVSIEESGDGPPFFLIGKRRLYSKSDLDAYMASRRVTQHPTPAEPPTLDTLPPKKSRRQAVQEAAAEVASNAEVPLDDVLSAMPQKDGSHV